MKKRMLAFMLVLVLTVGLLPAGAWAASGTMEGDGTAESPYLIADAADLATFRDKVNNGERTLCAKLTADIQLSGEWTPFNPNSGYVTDAYAGTFDGDGHTISGLSINTSAANQGLFGIINGATIKNLNVEGNISSTKAYIGGIVGKIQQGTIENCSFKGSVSTQMTGSSAYVGGIAGYAGNSSAQTATINGCVNLGSVGGGVAGGITGYAKYSTIANCYNTGVINGTSHSGGIIGQSMNNTTITNCYNTGEVTSSGNAGGITGFNGVANGINNCYWTQPEDCFKGGTGTKDDESCKKIDSVDGLAEELGSAFTTDERGNVILTWQAGEAPAPKDPKITITGASVLYDTNSGPKPSATLTVNYQDIADPQPVAWSLESGSNVVKLETPTNAGDLNNTVSVQALAPGKATVKATTGEYIAGIEITVFPFVTTVEIKGTAAVGETVKAKINVLGGTELDYETFPVSVQWKYKSNAADSSFTDISGAVGREFAIPNDYAGRYLSFTYRYQNEDKSPSSLSLIKASGEVEPSPQPPTTNKELEEALQWYTMYPVCGTDTNVNTVLKDYLADKGFADIEVSIRSVEEIYGGAGIADDGTITYFYVDPNTNPASKFGSYKVTFTLSQRGESPLETEVPIILYWDTAKVKATMQAEIMNKITVDTVNPVTENLSLPKAVDGKTWTLISWQSTDPDAISISAENQTTADTLFDPYVGVVKRGSEDKQVTLTATFTFQLTNDVNGSEAPITLVNTYTVTVPALGAETETETEVTLLAKLEAGFAAKGLTDAAAGERLVPDENGRYTVVNDILFPTTRDFNIDGKAYPVTITSSNSDVIVVPDVNNAARVEVYRPMPGKEAVEVTLTVTITGKSSGISASKTIPVTVRPLTQEEIDAELALMEQVKAHYFDGIKGGNATPGDITGNLSYFFEAYADENGELVWVRSNADRTNHGIVPVPMNDWEQTEQWRLFRSSNPEVIKHENLLVTQQKEHKSVTVTSYLSSETLGKYAERYPENTDLQKLYYQPVQADLIVTGTDPNGSAPVEERLTVTFTLQGNGSFGFTQTYRNLTEGTTVFEVFSRAMMDNGYNYAGHGTYIEAITTPTGVTLSEMDEGENSGWMYRVNGAIHDNYMGACTLTDGDIITVFYTGDFTNESGYTGGWDDVNAQNRDTPLTGVSGFADVPQTAWYAGAVEYVCNEKLMVGVGDDHFAPGEALSRAMLAAVLYRMAGTPGISADGGFTDVAEDQWYSTAAVWAEERGIVGGYGDGSFRPHTPVTRQELVAMLYRYARVLGMDTSGKAEFSGFADAQQIAPWAQEAVAWAVETGLLHGTDDGKLAPNSKATRAEVAALIQRFAALK